MWRVRTCRAPDAVLIKRKYTTPPAGRGGEAKEGQGRRKRQEEGGVNESDGALNSYLEGEVLRSKCEGGG